MTKKLGIKMIEMYENMIEDDFRDLFDKVRNNLDELKDIELQKVYEEDGMLGLLQEKNQLEIDLKHVEDKLNVYLRATYRKVPVLGKCTAVTNAEFTAYGRVRQQTNYDAILTAKKAIIRKLRLSEVSDTITPVFEELPGILKELQESFN